jgi:hypothetical protein
MGRGLRRRLLRHRGTGQAAAGSSAGRSGSAPAPAWAGCWRGWNARPAGHWPSTPGRRRRTGCSGCSRPPGGTPQRPRRRPLIRCRGARRPGRRPDGRRHWVRGGRLPVGRGAAAVHGHGRGRFTTASSGFLAYASAKGRALVLCQARGGQGGLARRRYPRRPQESRWFRPFRSHLTSVIAWCGGGRGHRERSRRSGAASAGRTSRSAPSGRAPRRPGPARYG